MDSNIACSAARYEFGEDIGVEFDPDRLSLSLKFRNDTILETVASIPLALSKNGFGENISCVKSIDATRDGLNVIFETERENAVAVHISSSGGGLRVKISSLGADRYRRIGINFAIPAGDQWYGADIMASTSWPLNSHSINRDAWLSTDNQTSPIWLSSRGASVYVKDYQSLGFQFHGLVRDSLSVYAMDSSSFEFNVILKENIREAFLQTMARIGIPQKVPPFAYFQKPVYCSWINFLTDVTQAGIVEYTEAMHRENFSCGIFMIDDRWMPKYGDLHFDFSKFPDPKRLVDFMHARGISVALWVTPFVDRDSSAFGFLSEKKYLILRKEKDSPYYAEWWNGNSAMLDLSNPAARQWFVSRLKALCDDYGIDGFKLDAGDGAFLAGDYRTARPMNPQEYTDAFAAIGSEFEINELRVSWLAQRHGLVQRLRDKAPTWSEVDGMGAIIPHGMTEGLIGYPFFCADMIGGGWDVYFRDAAKIDEELFVRWTEACALFPIMQFSYAPWRLSEKSKNICRRYAALHQEFADYIYECAKRSTESGMPIIAPLFLHFPDERDTYAIKNQFMLGEKYLVAPVVTAGSRSRDIYIPSGNWRAWWSDEIIRGPALLRSAAADLDVLPIYERI